jgi:hypothetical protein
MEYCQECNDFTTWILTGKVGFIVKCTKCRTEEEWDAEMIESTITPQFA